MSRNTKILFLASNPLDTVRIRLDKEARAIDQAIRQTDFGKDFEIQQHWAVRTIDLQNYLLRHKPDIVHFSGHGSESNEIILEDDLGNSHPVPAKALSQLFYVLKDNIRCVVLNACYSEQQAEAISKYIDCVIGMSNAVEDDSALNFSAAFYQALGFGRSLKTAFELGCIQINMENLDEQDVPKLIAPVADPDKIIFAQKHVTSVTHAKQSGNVDKIEDHLFYRISNLLESGKPEEAEREMSKATKGQRESAGFWYWKSRVASARENSLVALAYVEEALKKEPRNICCIALEIKLLITMGGERTAKAQKLARQSFGIAGELDSWISCMEEENFFLPGPWSNYEIDTKCPLPTCDWGKE